MSIKVSQDVNMPATQNACRLVHAQYDSNVVDATTLAPLPEKLHAGLTVVCH